MGKLRFLTNMSGDIDGIAAPFESDAPEIIFTLVPEKTAAGKEINILINRKLCMQGRNRLRNILVSAAVPVLFLFSYLNAQIPANIPPRNYYSPLANSTLILYPPVNV